MRVTTKGRYALRAAMALAEGSSPERPLSIKTIAEREDISAEFLEQIFFKLRHAGIVGSVRGPGGGFYLTRPPEHTSLFEILEAAGERFGLAPCVCGGGGECDRSAGCRARLVWETLDGRLGDFARGMSLADMLAGRLPTRG